jgi:hypothetical protein
VQLHFQQGFRVADLVSDTDGRMPAIGHGVSLLTAASIDPISGPFYFA